MIKISYEELSLGSDGTLSLSKRDRWRFRQGQVVVLRGRRTLFLMTPREMEGIQERAIKKARKAKDYQRVHRIGRGFFLLTSLQPIDTERKVYIPIRLRKGGSNGKT